MKFKNRLRRLFDLIDYQSNNEAIAFVVKRFGKWEKLSYKDYIKDCNRVSYSLIANGITKGNAIGSILDNRPEWNMIDLGIIQLGAIHVSIFPTFSIQNLIYTLTISKVEILFVSRRSLYRKILCLQKKIPDLKRIILVGKDEISGFGFFLKEGNAAMHHEALIKAREVVAPSDICSILYTSGTSNETKGVPHTHSSFLQYSLSLADTYGDACGDNVFSFLPLCHGFERAHSYYYQIYGKTIYYGNYSANFNAVLQEIRPDFFTTVPIVLDEVKKMIAKNNKYNNLTMISVSGAPLASSVIEFFSKYNIRLLESYGSTECLGITANTNTIYKEHTVGQPLNYVKIKLDIDGEILVKSPTVFHGYIRSSDEDSSYIDADGFFGTGDIGELDSNGFLKIVGRKNDFFKTQDGRFFNPVPVEHKLKQIAFVTNAMVIGAGKPYLSALLCISSDCGNDQSLISGIEDAINKLNAELSVAQRIVRYSMLFEDWTSDSTELTHNLKLRRTFVQQKYVDVIKAMYS